MDSNSINDIGIMIKTKHREILHTLNCCRYAYKMRKVKNLLPYQWDFKRYI